MEIKLNYCNMIPIEVSGFDIEACIGIKKSLFFQSEKSSYIIK